MTLVDTRLLHDYVQESFRAIEEDPYSPKWTKHPPTLADHWVDMILKYSC